MGKGRAFYAAKASLQRESGVIALKKRSRSPEISPQTGGAGSDFAFGEEIAPMEARCQDDCGINARAVC